MIESRENNVINTPVKITLTACILFLFAGIFYLYEFFVRTSIGTIEPFFRLSVNVDAKDIAIISSAFSIGYVLMQIPVGILFDKFELKICGFFAILAVSIGCLIFSLSTGVYTAFLGRFTMGVGAAFALLMMLNVSITCFPSIIAGGMTGLTSIFGIIGPILAGGPLAYYLVSTENNWSLLFKLLAVFGTIFAVVFYLMLSGKKRFHKKESKFALKIDLRVILTQKKLWGIAAFGFFVYPSIELFGSLYGSDYMTMVGYKHTLATTIVSFAWLGMGLFTPVVGFII